MTGNPAPRVAAALFACLMISASCSSKDSAPATRTASSSPAASRAKTNDSAAGSIDLGGAGNYKPSTLGAIGAIKGTIRLDGALPIDSTAPPTAEKVCLTKSAGASAAAKGGLGDAIVWVADATTGKAMSEDKRLELSSDDCLLEPRVQAAGVGSTVNVFNDDKAIHRLVFINAAGDTIQRMPFFNEGQVVASEVLAKSPGIVEVRCLQHPWMRAYIAVFDHPYFAVTENDGSFKIDSLPPGKYTVNVWHEGLKKPVTQTVTVAANGVAALDVAVKP